ncbi:CBO0543 family protein [Virgibacillus ndiopensis]|uniref:CBO0543 family protein n=1 Tax=Virgibacillus ndiopensis TaxID=2004408 RepID=UPI003CCC3185
MNTVTRWRGSNSQSSQKKSFYTKISDKKAILCTILFSTLIGTYLDLIMVGNGLYSFPNRPFPTIFSINILFTFVILPVLTVSIIYLFKKLTTLLRLGFVLIIFFLLPFIEHLSEFFGVFIHSNDWHHLYSSFGYTFFIVIIWKFYTWLCP